MQFFCISLLGAVSLTAASIIHFAAEPQTGANDQAHVYSEQNSKLPFYSYGYSGKTSAKAEYTSADGYAKGFYSYIDANGELQTVRYVAGNGEGFKAAATNLPVDTNAADTPQPVTDTPEVRRAKLEHFEAYRATEMRDALANTESEQEQQQQDEQQQHYNTDTEYVENAGLLALRLSATANNNERLHGDANDNDNGDGDGAELRYGQERSDTLDDDSSGGYYGRREQDDQTTTSVRVPIHAYYTLVAPTTRYSVLTPTILRTIQLQGRDANKLPISLSTTYVSQRLK